MDDAALLQVCRDAAAAARTALDTLDDWGLAGTRVGQYHSDLATDPVVIEILGHAGLGVLSEESGVHDGDRELLAVVDPVDGSTNASRGVPWFATSICILDADGPRVSLVQNLATGTRFEAVRGSGATRDGEAIAPSTCEKLSDAVVGLSGWPHKRLGWRQFRALGACALDLCAVASGTLDAFIDCGRDAHGPWDYLGGLLVCREAGAVVGDAFERDLVTNVHADRRTVLAAATAPLMDAAREARASLDR